MKKINKLLVLILLISLTKACTTPVFRYALERWQQSPYKAIIFYNGSSKQEQKLVTKFQELKKTYDLNIDIETVDFTQTPSQKMQDIWINQNNPKLPWIALYYPNGIETLVWAGMLTPNSMQKIVFSPKRKEIAQKLLNGDSIVWILLKSGNKKEDNKAEFLIKNNLKKLEKTIKLNVDSNTVNSFNSPEKSFFSNIPLKIKFSLICISRRDLKEEVFINMLLNNDKRTEQCFDKPMVFSVFGRGRFIGTLIGEGINENTIKEGVNFLTGDCSCEIKMMNLGTDILMAFDLYGNKRR